MQTTNDLFLKILDIIKYSDDKKKFLEELETLNQIEALETLAERLPDKIKKKKELSEEDYERIKQHVTQQDFIQEVEKAAQRQLKEYLKVISPTFTQEQKEQVEELMRQQKSNRFHKNPLSFLTRITQKIFRQ